MKPTAFRVGLMLLGAALAPACHRHRAGGHRAWGPPFAAAPAAGIPREVLTATRVLNPARVALAQPFVSAVLTEGAALGIADGNRLFRLDGARTAGGEAVDAFRGERVVVLTPGGGATVYALVDGTRAYVARSDDAGRTWTRGAIVAPGPLPPVPLDYGRWNVEAIPGLAASGRIVAFWLGEDASVSRDGGATFAAVDLGGAVRSAAVSKAGSIMALVHSRPPPDDEPTAVVRVDPAGAITRTLLAHTDACAAGQVFALSDGAVALGSTARSFLGTCARVSRNDGRTFEEVFADENARSGIVGFGATPSGIAYRVHEFSGGTLAQEGSADGARSFALALPPRSGSRPWDADASGRVAVAASDALLSAPPGVNADRLEGLNNGLRADARYERAVAAQRDAIAWMDSRGVVALVDRGADGPRLRQFDSPCSFIEGPEHSPYLDPYLAFDGAGHLCCVSAPRGGRPGPSACADVRADSPVFQPTNLSFRALSSGEGAVGGMLATGSHLPGCLSTQDGELVARALDVQPAPIGRAGLGPTEVSCADGGAVAVQWNRTMWDTVAMSGREGGPFGITVPAPGPRGRLFARRNGSTVFAFDTPEGITVRTWRGAARRTTALLAGRHGEPSWIAPWDDDSVVFATPGGIVAASRFGARFTPFAERERYVAVARVGDALVGLTPEGRFAVLEARTP